jgi:glycosyltransferase 2 family protein
MNNKKLSTGTLFLITGIGLFWYVYQDINFQSIKVVLKELKYGWIYLSIILGLISSLVRALRWKILIDSIGYKPRILNLFLSVQILYFINLVIPRGGEIARCGILAKYEKIPFAKLLGTVFIERITDLFAFIIIFTGVFFLQLSLVKEIFSTLKINPSEFQSNIMIFMLIALLLVLSWWIIKKTGLLDKFQNKINKIKEEIIDGIKSVMMIKKRWTYIFLTFLIFLLWQLMFYVVFFAYSPTCKMTLSASIFADIIGTFAFLLPIQAGIGVWHFLVSECLYLFGLNREAGRMFALVAHTFTNLIYLIFGTLGFVIFPVINNGSTEKQEKQIKITSVNKNF